MLSVPLMIILVIALFTVLGLIAVALRIKEESSSRVADRSPRSPQSADADDWESRLSQWKETVEPPDEAEDDEAY